MDGLRPNECEICQDLCADAIVYLGAASRMTVSTIACVALNIGISCVRMSHKDWVCHEDCDQKRQQRHDDRSGGQAGGQSKVAVRRERCDRERNQRDQQQQQRNISDREVRERGQ